TGMMSGSVTRLRPDTPGGRGCGTKPLETEAPDARSGANAVDPRLHRRECRLELDSEASEHHDAGRECRVGERDPLADEILVPTEAVAQEVEAAAELLARLVDALHVPLRVGLAELREQHRRRRDEGVVAVVLEDPHPGTAL